MIVCLSIFLAAIEAIHGVNLDYANAHFQSSDGGERKCHDKLAATNIVCYNKDLCDDRPTYGYLKNGSRVSCQIKMVSHNGQVPRRSDNESVAVPPDFLNVSCHGKQRKTAALTFRWGYEARYLQDALGFYLIVQDEELSDDISRYYAKLVIEDVTDPQKITQDQTEDCLIFTFNCHGKSRGVYTSSQYHVRMHSVPIANGPYAENALELHMEELKNHKCAVILEDEATRRYISDTTTYNNLLKTDVNSESDTQEMSTNEIHNTTESYSATDYRTVNVITDKDGYLSTRKGQMIAVLICVGMLDIVLLTIIAYLRSRKLWKKRCATSLNLSSGIRHLLIVAGSEDSQQAKRLSENLRQRGFDLRLNWDEHNKIVNSPTDCKNWYLNALDEADALVLINANRFIDFDNNNCIGTADQSEFTYPHNLYQQPSLGKGKWLIFLNSDPEDRMESATDATRVKYFNFEHACQEGTELLEFLDSNRSPC